MSYAGLRLRGPERGTLSNEMLLVLYAAVGASSTLQLGGLWEVLSALWRGNTLLCRSSLKIPPRGSSVALKK